MLFCLWQVASCALKPVSVPCLELTAAVLAAKISQFVIRECDFKFLRVFLWTDSTVVLRYINNTSARFKTFVANRLEIIHSLTNVNDWHFVPTASNPADLASRGVWPDKCQSADIWFHGPLFLRNIAVDWPRQPDFLQELSGDDPKVKKTEVCMTQLKFPQNSACLHRLFRRYSNFKDLQRTVIWLLRFIEFLKMKSNPHYATPNQQSITVVEMIQAERAIVRVAQSQVFGDIIPVLRNHEGFYDPVKLITEQQLRDNPSVRKLQTLNPYLVDGIIQVGGRLQR